MTLLTQAVKLSRELVEPLGRRWWHVRAVADKAETLAYAVAPNEKMILLTAAWLHDIGYSPRIGETRFHPLDGARFLRDQNWPGTIVNLVAHHSGARFEAVERGLSTEINEFPFADSPVMDALVTADLTTGPGGEEMTYEERITEILERYPDDHPVHRTWVKAAPVLKECVVRTEERLARAQPR
ncbi:HD domain-containing protein [Saccharomonospora iraqiensis]|uniref:HD domain-containing protein n=1 Tax=Saccharomonospora iraqiensis TaxID=52698 RepID=UPI001F1C22CA|nr:HD domain-containing protein [Saccharomonospora iraqiensis]